jgi:hypothetical protein
MKKIIIISLLISLFLVIGCKPAEEELVLEDLETAEETTEPAQEIEEPVEEPVEVTRDCEADGYTIVEEKFEAFDQFPEFTELYCDFGDGSACFLQSYNDGTCDTFKPECKNIGTEEEGWYWPDKEPEWYWWMGISRGALIRQEKCEDLIVECKSLLHYESITDGWYVGAELLEEYDCYQIPVI